jgi:RNA polymerase sigma factor (sigma-70 family)
MAAAIRRPGDDEVPASAAARVSRPDELLPLARAAGAKDPAAAASLVAHVAPFVLKVVRGVIGRHHPDVDDIAQDAIIALLASLPSFRGESSVVHYAGRIALFTALAARKRERGRLRRVDGDSADAPFDAPASPLADLISSRRREILLGLLDELPTATAEAIALHFILGYTVNEIARTADVSVNTVWSRLRLGREALTRRLARDKRLADLLRGAP